MEKKKLSNWSDITHLQRGPRSETRVPECMPVIHHVLLSPLQGTGVHRIVPDHNNFLLQKQAVKPSGQDAWHPGTQRIVTLLSDWLSVAFEELWREGAVQED